MDATPPSVTVSLRSDDAARVQQALTGTKVLSLSKAALLSTVVGGIATGGLSGIWSALGGPATTLWTWAAFAWPGAIALTWLGARRLEAATNVAWTKGDPRGEAREFAIDADGFVSRGADYETRIRWNGVEEIRETQDDVLVITRWKEIYCAPKRCFADAAAAAAFAAQAQAFKNM